MAFEVRVLRGGELQEEEEEDGILFCRELVSGYAV